MDIHVPQITELIPQERISPRIVEQIVDVSWTAKTRRGCSDTEHWEGGRCARVALEAGSDSPKCQNGEGLSGVVFRQER